VRSFAYRAARRFVDISWRALRKIVTLIKSTHSFSRQNVVDAKIAWKRICRKLAIEMGGATLEAGGA
jgi:hypothetical protein